MSAQGLLDFTPPVERVLLIRATPEQIRDAHKPATIQVLRMLQAGPCTTHDFLAAHIGRFGARVGELRQVGWDIVSKKVSDHGFLYIFLGWNERYEPLPSGEGSR